ncbi:MAG: hypothetical protein WCJ85_12570 [Chitinophagaceae bacterium]
MMKNDVLGTGIPVNKNDLKHSNNKSKTEQDLDAKTENSNRTFTAAEFWDIQKRQRTTNTMRRWMS